MLWIKRSRACAHRCYTLTHNACAHLKIWFENNIYKMKWQNKEGNKKLIKKWKRLTKMVESRENIKKNEITK